MLCCYLISWIRRHLHLPLSRKPLQRDSHPTSRQLHHWASSTLRASRSLRRAPCLPTAPLGRLREILQPRSQSDACQGPEFQLQRIYHQVPIVRATWLSKDWAEDVMCDCSLQECEASTQREWYEQTECTVCTVQNVWWKKSELGVKRANSPTAHSSQSWSTSR